MKNKLKEVLVSQVYNDGVIHFYTKKQKLDNFNTPIRGEFEREQVYKDWYRQLGITVEDAYYSRSLQQDVTLKVAVKGNLQIQAKWYAVIETKEFELFRVFYNWKADETEISLMEVSK